MTRFTCSVSRPCDVCDGEDFQHMATLRTARAPGLALPVAICRKCGFVTQRPRLSPADYRRVNQIWYRYKFAADAPTDQDEGKKFRKWTKMWERIAPWYPDGPAGLLDVGAGQGWAIEFLKRKFPAMAATAIEQWGPCQDYIRGQLGAEVVDVDISGVWPATLRERFDLVIFRHTIEHLEEPLAALHQIAAALRPGGHCYLVAPNAMYILPDTPMATDYFRPVHLHYFNATTLSALAARAGLSATVVDASGGEVWGLFRRMDEQESPVTPSPSIGFEEQRAFLGRRIREARGIDLRRSLRIEALRLLPSFLRRSRAG